MDRAYNDVPWRHGWRYLDFARADVLAVHLVQRAYHALDVVELYESEHLVRLLVLDIDFLWANERKTTALESSTRTKWLDERVAAAAAARRYVATGRCAAPPRSLLLKVQTAAGHAAITQHNILTDNSYPV